MSDPQPEQIRLLPFGGLGEIGMNMMGIEYAGKILLIDCGLMFPEAYMFGIDLVLPDISALEQRQEDIVGLVLTHGHEDHIGAIPFLWRQLGKPVIYGTTLTLGLLRSKLKEFELRITSYNVCYTKLLRGGGRIQESAAPGPGF